LVVAPVNTPAVTARDWPRTQERQPLNDDFITLDIVIRSWIELLAMTNGRTKAVGRRGTAGRVARRRLETRARLVRAARELMARKGVGATSIQEITEAADVGFGSFYNHFDSKETIAAAVMAEAIESFGTAADRLAEVLEDPAEILAASVRHAVARAAADEAWGWFLVRTALTRTGVLRGGLGARLARDIRIGLERGRFEANDPLAAMLAAGGAILAIIAGRLQGDIGDDAPERAATVVLNLVGLRAKEAATIACRPLPAIAAPQDAATGERDPAGGRRRVRSAP
jgi:AcrR family transcriptional regulator